MQGRFAVGSLANEINDIACYVSANSIAIRHPHRFYRAIDFTDPIIALRFQPHHKASILLRLYKVRLLLLEHFFIAV